VEVARRTGADAVSHGATGKGNDQVRFELTYQALAPDLKIIVPWREWDLAGRAECVAFAEKHGIPVPVTVEKPYSSDRNLLHISFEGGILEDPWAEPPADMFVLTASPEAAPDKPQYVEIDFEHGDPVAVDGAGFSPANLLARLNGLGGEHGIGRVDLVENRYVGLKSRGVYETPGGAILRAAHQAVESLTLDREVMHLRDSLMPRYAELVYYGYWYAPERQVLQKLIDAAQQPVTGTARLKLYKGNVTVVGRRAPKSLYQPSLVTFEAGGRLPAGGRHRLHPLKRPAPEDRRQAGREVRDIDYRPVARCRVCGHFQNLASHAGLGQTACEAWGAGLPEPRTGLLTSWPPGAQKEQNFVK